LRGRAGCLFRRHVVAPRREWAEAPTFHPFEADALSIVKIMPGLPADDRYLKTVRVTSAQSARRCANPLPEKHRSQ
jgi:hypothetical protein